MRQIALALILCFAGWSAQADPAATPLADDQLQAYRAGFSLLDAQELNFSASVKSYLDGALVLESRLVWSSAGLPPHEAPTHSGALPSEVLASLSAQGIDMPALTEGGSAFISPDGQTLFLHHAESGQLSNILLNTGDGHTLRQEINVNLDLPGFEATQAGMREALAMRAIADEIRLGLGLSD
jgi:hypothetical protein